ncbi:hypothetical protein K438DRAFT_1986673 [Mycena galopus ATCC 62051]|nr:hypothetical protein K438DRAFT_1986673 [Mycena galopus ATCC 62051]
MHSPMLYAKGEETVTEAVFLLRWIGPVCDVRTHPPALVRQVQYLNIAPCCCIPYHHGLIQTSSDHFHYLPVNSRSTPGLSQFTSGSSPDDIQTTTG